MPSPPLPPRSLYAAEALFLLILSVAQESKGVRFFGLWFWAFHQPTQAPPYCESHLYKDKNTIIIIIIK